MYSEFCVPMVTSNCSGRAWIPRLGKTRWMICSTSRGSSSITWSSTQLRMCAPLAAIRVQSRQRAAVCSSSSIWP
ncbi:hypothetical protein D3C84_680300 [compost metagenome]